MALRRQLSASGADAGPETIAWHLAQEGHRAPSTSTIRRVLHAEGLIVPEPRKRPRSSYVRFEADLPNGCWQADITHCFLADGTRVEVLDFLDDHSRYLLYARAAPAFTGAMVVAAMQDLSEALYAATTYETLIADLEARLAQILRASRVCICLDERAAPEVANETLRVPIRLDRKRIGAIIVGVLHLYGFALPETHKLFFLSSSFTDFWRRINIYWKDFMMKLVYYPSFFRLRRWGGTVALVGSTIVVFAVTWLLHSYQWFWILGTFPLTIPDILFWGILGVIDGEPPLGVEDEHDVEARKRLLRDIGYKL